MNSFLKWIQRRAACFSYLFFCDVQLSIFAWIREDSIINEAVSQARIWPRIAIRLRFLQYFAKSNLCHPSKISYSFDNWFVQKKQRQQSAIVSLFQLEFIFFFFHQISKFSEQFDGFWISIPSLKRWMNISRLGLARLISCSDLLSSEALKFCGFVSF